MYRFMDALPTRRKPVVDIPEGSNNVTGNSGFFGYFSLSCFYQTFMTFNMSLR